MAGIKIIAQNKRARYDYFLEKSYEAGLQLKGTEIKSLREGKCHIVESYVEVDERDEVWIHNMHIEAYKFGNINNHQERRKRKLLLNKREILEISRGVQIKGHTIVAVKLYLKRNFAKMEIALAKGKKLYDKRNEKAKRDVERKLRQNKGHLV